MLATAFETEGSHCEHNDDLACSDCLAAVALHTVRAARPDEVPADEYTWRHNAFVAEHEPTRDRGEAEVRAARCRAANPGHDVGVVTRTVTEWREVSSRG